MSQLNLVQQLNDHDDRVWCLSWSVDGTKLASCSGDNKLIIWKQIDNKWSPFQIITNAHRRTVRRIHFSPDGKLLAVASFDAKCSVWEEDSDGVFKSISLLEGHENEVKCATWDNSGLLLATCSRDKNIWIWELEGDNEFECVSVCTGHTQDVKTVKWHPTRELLFSASYDDTIKVWKEEGDDWYCASTLTEHNKTVWDLCFNSDGTKLASVSGDKKLIIWSNEPSGQSITTWNPSQIIENCHDRDIYTVDWSSNGTIATGGGDDNICLWKLNNETNQYQLLLKKIKAHNNDVNCVCWKPNDSTILASCGDDNIIKIWKLE
jgi:WD40 repeat protein